MQRNATAPKSPQGSNQSNVYWAYHDSDSAAKLSTTLVHALADVIGEDVTTMYERIYESVDPEALDAVFRDRFDGTARVNGHLSFTVYDHLVTVYASGDIAIEPPAAPPQHGGHR